MKCGKQEMWCWRGVRCRGQSHLSTSQTVGKYQRTTRRYNRRNASAAVAIQNITRTPDIVHLSVRRIHSAITTAHRLTSASTPPCRKSKTSVFSVGEGRNTSLQNGKINDVENTKPLYPSKEQQRFRGLQDAVKQLVEAKLPNVEFHNVPSKSFFVYRKGGPFSAWTLS